MNGYSGIFYCYTPGNSKKCLISTGLFTVDDLYQLNIKLDEELKNIKNNAIMRWLNERMETCL